MPHPDEKNITASLSGPMWLKPVPIMSRNFSSDEAKNRFPSHETI